MVRSLAQLVNVTVTAAYTGHLNFHLSKQSGNKIRSPSSPLCHNLAILRQDCSRHREWIFTNLGRRILWDRKRYELHFGAGRP